MRQSVKPNSARATVTGARKVALLVAGWLSDRSLLCVVAHSVDIASFERATVVQDGSILHGPPGLVMEVGPGATVAHLCVVHGAVLEEECLVANGCTVLDGARIGARSMVAAHSLVAADAVIPPGVLAAGSPAVVKRPIDGTPAEFWVRTNPGAYRELAVRHRLGVRQVG